tara:strand:+ start:512 stop:2503 length:1992 start_codon:yes stop_codon:yes gene_type:complete
MSEFKLYSEFACTGDQKSAVSKLKHGIENNEKWQTLLGVTGSGKTFTMANLIQEIQKPTIIMSHNKTLAAQLYGEFKSLFPNNSVEFFISYYDYYQPEAYLPVTDTFIEKDSSINEDIDRLRLKATESLLTRKDVIVVSSVSCIYGIGSPDDYQNKVVKIEKGKKIVLRNISRQLIEIYYVRSDSVFERGRFRVRGDIIEIFPAYEDHGIRIDLFGNEIESIKRFNPLTGEVLGQDDMVFIYPAKHFVTDDESIGKIIDLIKDELAFRLDYLLRENKLLEAQRLEQRTNFDIEMMLEVGYCSGIENYSRYFSGRKEGERPYTLLDYFPDDYIMFLDESHVTLPQIQGMYHGDRSRKETLVEYGFRLPSALDNRPLKYNEFESCINNAIFVSATPSEREHSYTGGTVVEQIIRPTGLIDPIIDVRSTSGQIDDLIGEIKNRVVKKERVLVTTLTKRMSEDLCDYLMGVNLKVRYLHSDIDSLERVKILRELRLGTFDVLVGINLLREGLDLPEVSLVVVLDADKEGFLRSARSLMQVAGRASRNVNGRVIFYGDKVSNSMKSVIEESDRRRNIQIAHNKKFGIIPKTVKKTTDDVLLSTSVADTRKINDLPKTSYELDVLSSLDLDIALDIMTNEMLEAADNHDFEKAAIIRDEIENLQTKMIK